MKTSTDTAAERDSLSYSDYQLFGTHDLLSPIQLALYGKSFGLLFVWYILRPS